MRSLKNLNLGDSVYFVDDANPFVVKSKLENYIIATSESGGCKEYTIIDTDKDVCAPHDRVFNPYDFTNQIDIDKCINDLVDGKYNINLSERHLAKVEDVIDLDETLRNF